MAPISMEKQHAQRTTVVVNDFIRSVYNWMFIGLALTALTAMYVSGNETILRFVFGNSFVFFGLIIGELALVFTISGMVNRINGGTATALFVIYSILNGITLSVIFLAYAQASIVSTFFVCSATFLACSIYGWTTKRDLTSWGGFFLMGLIGIIIASVVNMFFRSDSATMIISYIGVIVFVGLTAYDTQRLKNMALMQPEGGLGGRTTGLAIAGALALYLDFINLFLMLLRIFGGGRD